ncbi:MAG: response regulator [Deltaproteobacteria bacterium]
MDPALPLRFDDLARLDWLQAPLWAFDIEARRMIWANAAGLDLWNAKSLEELGARDYSDMSEAAVTRFRAALERMARGEVLHEQWTLYPNGKPTTVSVTRVAVRLEDGTLASLQEAQSAALVDPETLRGVEALHHTNLRIALFRGDGGAVMQNPAAVRTFGPTSDEVDAFAALFVDETEAARARATIGQGAVYSAEVPLCTAAGPRWHGLDARGVPDPVTGAPFVLVNARDIEDRRTAEEALIRSVASQRRFLAAISHEIRTPLNSVVGFVDLLRGTQLSEQQRAYAVNAHTSAQHLSSLVSDVLDVSKVQADQLELTREELDIEDVLLESLVIASTQMRPGVNLTYTIPEVDSFVHGDRVRLTQIFVNLLGNAAKFTDEGFVRLRLAARETEGGSEGGVGLRVIIEDSGIGIPEGKIADLFSPFAQAHTSKRGGTGLGLYLSRSLARIMGGDIRVDSAVGEGSAFTVDLTLPRGRSRVEDIDLGGRRVLLLSRDDDMTLSLPDRFRRAGAVVVAPAEPSTGDALRLCLATGACFDVIVLDLDMSSGSRALASVLRELFPQAKIVGVVARPDAAEHSVDVVVAKPFTFYRLARLLEARRGGQPDVVQAGELRGMRVLVAEDVEMNIGLLRAMFSTWFDLGFDLARDGREAVGMARSTEYDLILMDMQMPLLDGIEATREIRSFGSRVPIVALTASAMSDDVERARAAGVDGYLTKPVRRSDLTRELRRHAPSRVASLPPIAPQTRVIGLAPPAVELEDVARRHFETLFGAARAPRLLASSIRGVQAGLAEIERARAGGDPAAIGRALHMLAGILLNSGLSELGARASAAGRCTTSGVDPDHGEIDRVLAEIGPYSRCKEPAQ